MPLPMIGTSGDSKDREDNKAATSAEVVVGDHRHSRNNDDIVGGS